MLKRMKSMDNKLLSNPRNSRFSFWLKVVLGLIGGIVLVALSVFGVLSLIIWSGTRMPEYLEIEIPEVPIYTNAHNVSFEGPIIEYGTEIYTWSFSSSDAPDMVWQFYLDEMSQRWGFVDRSAPQSFDKILVVHSCPFYYLKMTSSQNNANTYDYIIRFNKEGCR